MAGSPQRVAQQRPPMPCSTAPRRRMVLGPITATGARSRVKIDAEAGELDNSWVDLDYSLVDPKTQDSYRRLWHRRILFGPRQRRRLDARASARPTTDLAAHPGGQYDLVVDATAHRWTDPERPQRPAMGRHLRRRRPRTGAGGATVPVTVTVDRGGVFGGNILARAAGDPDLADHRLVPPLWASRSAARRRSTASDER